MATVVGLQIPPEWQDFLDKITRWYDNQIYPTWSLPSMHLTRSSKATNKAKTFLPDARVFWAALTAPEKNLWKMAMAFQKLSGWNYFIEKYSYYIKHNLPLDLTPHQLYQMFGLRLSSTTTDKIISAVFDEKDLIGPLRLRFSYRQLERHAPSFKPFFIHADLYYFDAGQNIVETFDWESPAGNVDWSPFDESFGSTGKKLFHVVLTFESKNYNGDIFIDNLWLTDGLHYSYKEPFKVKAGKNWVYIPLYRKQGWSFSFPFDSEEIKVLFLE